MTEGKGNGKASDSVTPQMDEEMLEEEKDEAQDEIKEKELMGGEQEIQEEDSKKDGDEAKKSHIKIHQKTDNVVDAGIEGDTKVHNEVPIGAKSDSNNEEGEIHKDSANMNVGMQSNMHAPDKFIDTAVGMKEKICGRNEQISAGPHGEQQSDLMSVGNGYVKCERDVDNSKEVKIEENTKEVSMFAEQRQTFMFDDPSDGGESGTEEEQSAFMKEVENLYREKSLEFKAPKFYGEPLNLLKLWRAVIKLGGYDKVTACKLWRQVGESFNPPKTCTTVSWTFRIFYEKALLEYERHKIGGGELDISASLTEPMSMGSTAADSQASGSGRQRRDAATRAMQGWHSQRLLGSGEVSDPLIKDKSSIPLKSREKHLKNIGGQKRKKSLVEAAAKASPSKLVKGVSDAAVIDIGPAADWVKIIVRTTKDCYEVYALVPGLLREEVHVQSDPAGRLVITGEPEQAENPWGVTPFKKVVNLPSRIDPHQTSAVVTLHGQLFVRVPFEQSE